MISKSQEEYLKTMYILNKQNGIIRVTDVANKLNVTKAGVSKVLHILKDNGFVQYETYGKITLTESGNNLAKKILEAYDISYVFLKDVINVDKDIAKLEAEKLKLTLSDETLNLLAKYVHKELGISNLDCCYDINKEKCRRCSKRKELKIRKIRLKKKGTI